MAARRERTPPSQLEGYVLHRWDWSESSLVLDLFTRERGRLAVVAKGAKRPTSQLRAVLLPFQRVQATLARTAADEQGEIQVLRHAEWAGGGALLPAAALFQGFYLNELLLRLLARADPHAALFDAYTATLPALAHGDEQIAQAGLRAFELVLLRETGVLPDLAITTLGQQAVQPGGRYALRPESGLVAQADGGGVAGALWLALQGALDEGSAVALQRACLAHLAPLKGMLRQLLHYHLGSQRLHTREVMHSVQRLVDRSTPAAQDASTR